MNGRLLLSDLKFYTDYSKYDYDKQGYETWYESVDRVMGMHKKKFSHINNEKFDELLDFTTTLYKNKQILGSQRALQFGGEPMFRHQARMFNCLTNYADRIKFFQETFYLLLCGCGVGFSVQKHHIERLPTVKGKGKRTKTFVVPDSIEGWSDALGVLLSSYFTGVVPFPKYQGVEVHFDFSEIRPKGSFITGGFKAPGHKGLQQSLNHIDTLLKKATQNDERQLKPIEVYDIVMHTADAVLSGGVRRSATICVFSPDDEEMMNAKTGNWYETNPQRARSNNSALLIRGETSYAEYKRIAEKTKQFGEPAFIWSWHRDIMFNPCVEISMFPQIDGISGNQGCNLSEINGSMCNTEQEFYDACKAASIIATLQASYTDFKYLGEESKRIFDREALIGVSITGFANNPEILFDEEILRKGARIVNKYNKIVSEIIGINPAARTTCVKPSGNASVVLQTASGIHPEHSTNYFRVMQMNKESEFTKYIMDRYPYMVEESVWSATKSDVVVFVPVSNDNNVLTKKDMIGVDHLKMVKKVQNSWVAEGTQKEYCTVEGIQNNVSNTIIVDDWDEVFDYIFENQNFFTGTSFIPNNGDKLYNQAPFTSVLMMDELVEKYGEAYLFASGLIVDGLHAFNNLWDACSTALFNTELEQSSENALKLDWVRRFNQYGERFLGGDLNTTAECLKDVHLYHRWVKINRYKVDHDLHEVVKEPKYTDIDTMGSMACSGGQCSIDDWVLDKMENK